MSNNPFRNRIQPQISPESSHRLVTNNPFLDATEINNMAVETNNNAPTTTNPVNNAAGAFVRAHTQTMRIPRAD